MCFAQIFKFGKFIGMDIANDRKMFARGLEILAEREDVGALRGEILHGGKHFVFFFAEAKHQTGFGRHIGMRFLGAAQQFE